MRQLLKEGADVNSLDENGDTPLHYTAARGVLNIVVALLDAGAKLLAVNGNNISSILSYCVLIFFEIIDRPGCISTP